MTHLDDCFDAFERFLGAFASGLVSSFASGGASDKRGTMFFGQFLFDDVEDPVAFTERQFRPVQHESTDAIAIDRSRDWTHHWSRRHWILRRHWTLRHDQS